MDKFIALSDPSRRRIIEMLCLGELSAGEIAGEFECSAPAVSQHLKALKAAGFVQVRKDAQRRLYRLNAEGLSEVDEWFEQIREYWGSRLDKLESELRKPAK